MHRRLPFQILFFIVLKVLQNTMVRLVYPFLPFFQAGLGVDAQQISLAISLRSGIGIFGPFLASIADQRGRKTGMIVGFILFSGGAALAGSWKVFPAFVAALILGLLGNLVFIPSMQAFLGDRVPYERRGQVLALTEFGWSLAFILGVPAAGWLIGSRGWQAPFLILAILGVLATGSLTLLMPPDRREHLRSQSSWQSLRRVFRHPAALAGVAMGASMAAANEVINVVFGVWMVETLNVQIATLGLTTAVIGFSELGGEALVALATDRVGKKRAIALGLVLNSLAVLALPSLGKTLPGAMVGLALFYFSFEFTLVSSIPLMTEILPVVRASMMASFIAFTAAGRSLADVVAIPLYSRSGLSGELSGILAVAVLATCLNLASLFFLRWVHLDKAVSLS